MSNSTSSIRPGALWAPHDEQESRHTLGIAVLVGLLIEAALVMGISHVDVSRPVPPAQPIMRVHLVAPEAPPPVVHKIIKPQPMAKPKVAKPKAHQAKAPVIHKIVRHRQVKPATEKPVARAVTRHAAERKVAPQPVAPIAAAAHPSPAAPAVATPQSAEKAAPTAAPAGPVEIGIACPTQVQPEMPAQALADGIEGRVVARARISGGRVISVDIVSANPPGVFDAAVRHAMMRYRCENNTDGVVTAEQTFNFALD